jgi:hypothetical protein
VKYERKEQQGKLGKIIKQTQRLQKTLKYNSSFGQNTEIQKKLVAKYKQNSS